MRTNLVRAGLAVAALMAAGCSGAEAPTFTPPLAQAPATTVPAEDDPTCTVIDNGDGSYSSRCFTPAR